MQLQCRKKTLQELHWLQFDTVVEPKWQLTDLVEPLFQWCRNGSANMSSTSNRFHTDSFHSSSINA